MTNLRIFRWLERGLLAVGLALGAWCVVVLVEAEFVAHMPVPDPPTSTTTSASSPSLMPVPTPTPTRGSWVAKLEAPSVHLAATVLEGTDDATLGRGAGHIEETPFPGEPGNIGIAGHRDTTFRAVSNLHTGDPIELTTRDRVYRYLIVKIFIVNPEDVYVLNPGDGPMLTLVTCYPFEFIGHAPRRYIIQGVLIDQAARVEAEAPGMAGKAGQ